MIMVEVNTLSRRCPIFPNYHTMKDGRCDRYFQCGLQGWSKDQRCPAKKMK